MGLFRRSALDFHSLTLHLIDGGGLRALSQAKIVQETIDRIAYDDRVAESDASRSTPRVVDYFDMICGSGFGGQVALCLLANCTHHST